MNTASSGLGSGQQEIHISSKLTKRAPHWLYEMNHIYAVVPMGGQTLVMRQTFGPTGDAQLQFQTFSEFKKLYQHQRVDLTVIQKDHNGKRHVSKEVSKATLWLNHPERRQHNGVVFAPGNAFIGPGYHNLWQGWPIQARLGDCSLFLQHIEENICQKNEELYRWVLAWMADAVQHPERRPGTALVLRGDQGTGKGFFAKHFGSLFGRHFIPANQPRHVTGNFNAHLQECLLLFADEWEHTKQTESILRSLITEDYVLIERKGIDVIKAHNYIRLIFASNAKWVVPAGLEERRFAVFDVGTLHRQDRQYFHAIDEQMNNGGREALLYYLQHLDLSKFPDPAVIPQTEALREQKLLSLSPFHRWWYARLYDGAQSSESASWEGWVDTASLHEDFLEFHKTHAREGRAAERAIGQFGKALKEIVPGMCVVRKKILTVRLNGYTFPSLEQCREAFARKLNMPLEWPEGETEET